MSKTAKEVSSRVSEIEKVIQHRYGTRCQNTDPFEALGTQCVLSWRVVKGGENKIVVIVGDGVPKRLDSCSIPDIAEIVGHTHRLVKALDDGIAKAKEAITAADKAIDQALRDIDTPLAEPTQ